VLRAWSLSQVGETFIDQAALHGLLNKRETCAW
jgi:hypothetical protein